MNASVVKYLKNRPKDEIEIILNRGKPMYLLPDLDTDEDNYMTTANPWFENADYIIIREFTVNKDGSTNEISDVVLNRRMIKKLYKSFVFNNKKNNK